MSPIVHVRLLQRRTTFTDFHLDRDIALQYSLLKLYVRSFTDDYDFARLAPQLPYRPNDRHTEEQRKQEPGVFCRQGLALGDLECVAELLTHGEDDKARPLQFGEFEKLLNQEQPDDNLQEVLNPFRAFSPERKPVLARLLLAQAFVAQLILTTYRFPAEPSQLPVRLDALLADKHITTMLAWSEKEATDLGPVGAYWRPRLENLGTTLLVPAPPPRDEKAAQSVRG